MRGWKKVLYANRDDKESGAVILISDQVDLRNKVYSIRQTRALDIDKGINSRGCNTR